jgi:hypothetical protein
MRSRYGRFRTLSVLKAAGWSVAASGIITLYATGTDGIEATAAEIARFKNAGVGVVLIDQTPSLSVFAAGLADIADVEQFAGTAFTVS